MEKEGYVVTIIINTVIIIRDGVSFTTPLLCIRVAVGVVETITLPVPARSHLWMVKPSSAYLAVMGISIDR